MLNLKPKKVYIPLYFWCTRTVSEWKGDLVIHQENRLPLVMSTCQMAVCSGKLHPLALSIQIIANHYHSIWKFHNIFKWCAWRGKFGKRLYHRWQEPCWALPCQKTMISVSEFKSNLEFLGSDSSAKFDHRNIILIVKSKVIHYHQLVHYVVKNQGCH